MSEGREYLDRLTAAARITKEESSPALEDNAESLEMLGTSLSALFQVATCSRGCKGGAHVLEALTGRVHNLAAAAYSLILIGYYDEALNLTRSIGEVANLLALSFADPEAIQEWLASDRPTRLQKFSPATVRAALEARDSELLIVDRDWYSRFCEAYTHVTPQTRPNAHSDPGQAFVGGPFQRAGFESSLGDLATLVGTVAMMACTHFRFDDLFESIARMAEE